MCTLTPALPSMPIRVSMLNRSLTGGPPWGTSGGCCSGREESPLGSSGAGLPEIIIRESEGEREGASPSPTLPLRRAPHLRPRGDAADARLWP